MSAKRPRPPAPPPDEIRSRANAVARRPYSLGDEALLVDAAAHLSVVALRFLDRANGDQNDVAHAAKCVAMAEELIAIADAR